MPPLALMYFGEALTASMLPWNSPGASGEPVSAITWTVMVSAVTPVSVASSVTPSHAALPPPWWLAPPPVLVRLVRPAPPARRGQQAERHEQAQQSMSLHMLPCWDVKDGAPYRKQPLRCDE